MALRRSMMLSVVVPAHNEEELLPRCLSALEKQTVSFELIVVNSASCDRTAEVAKRFGAKVISVKELGLARARQAGFQMAKGEVVATTDADSVPPPDWLEELTEVFRIPEVVGTYGPLALEGRGPFVRGAEKFFRFWQQLNHRLGRLLFCGPSFAVRKRAFEEVGGFKRGGTFYEDDETDIRLAFKLRRVGKVVFLPRVMVLNSARKLSGWRGLGYLAHHTANYFRLCWLHYGDV